ncbi:serine/threonine-protein kinase [Streptomyces xantholiticus]|uniref:serine/threonine-protein kinase n=1 Tax=Streptomyces xantholiticus TaxID=68285 RepID=UPI0019B0A499|nr:serine/threonine protein kinase [Streptomyces xantholiticus]GGW53319.1 hypothetical protein GCM10010381_43470 [Streptomyces xantholiticus]
MSGSGATPREPGDPRRIGAFTLLGVLGAGGMGRVYLGTASGRYAAVKQVLPILAEDRDFLRHFGHELDNLARLPAGASAALLAGDRTAQPPWFATEYIPGITLNDAVRVNGGPLTGNALWLLLREAASGLRRVHATGMVHRDLKPSNVMLTTDSLTLIDFGVARAADQSRLTRTGMVIGTPAYMAPEQAVAERRLTGAADVFALGSLMLYAANGRPPFGDGSGPGLLYRIVHTEPDVGTLPDTDPELFDVVKSCLAKSPADRPTAGELLDLADERTTAEAEATWEWPSPVAERIAERVAFAATPPTVAAEPEEPEEPEEEPRKAEPESPPATTGAKKKRRIRVPLVIVIPIVVGVGTTLTLALAPFESTPEAKGPGANSAPPTPTGSPPASPSNTPSPNASLSPSGSPSPGTTTAGPAPGVPAPGPAQGGGGGSDATGGTDPGGDSGGSGGGTNTPGGGQAPKPPEPDTPQGNQRLTNSANGKCLAEHINGGLVQAAPSTCGAPSSNGGQINYDWNLSGSGGTFRLVSGSGRCLAADTNNFVMSLDSCSGSSDQLWRIGSTTSAGSTLKNASTDRCLAMSDTNVITSGCNTSDASQLWRGL